MGRKIQSYTLSDVTTKRLESYASANCISKSRAVEKILDRFLLVEATIEISPTDIPYEKTVKPMPHIQTEEERLFDWEWRKDMVNKGKLAIHMGEEYPKVDRAPGFIPVYLTTDGKVNDTPIPLDSNEKIMTLSEVALNAGIDFNKEEPMETQQEMEDREFDESLAMSLAEKE